MPNEETNSKENETTENLDDNTKIDLEKDLTPFYNKFPWAVLTNPVETRRVKPLEVDIQEILPSFSVKMKEDGKVDLRISGRVLYSASLIYRMKTDFLIKFVKALDESIDEIEKEEYPPLRIPFRLSPKKVTMDELLVALSEVLIESESKKFSDKQKLPKENFQLRFQYEPDRINIESFIEKVFARILNQDKENKGIFFDDLLQGTKKIDVVRVFLCLLYLLNRQQIEVIRDPETNKLIIKVEAA